MANKIDSTALVPYRAPNGPLCDAEGRFLRPARNAGEFIEEAASIVRAERIVSEEHSLRSWAPIRGRYTAAPETAKVVGLIFEKAIGAPRLGGIVTGYVGADYGDGYDFRFVKILEGGRMEFTLVTPYDVCRARLFPRKLFETPHDFLNPSLPFMLLEDQALIDAREKRLKVAPKAAMGVCHLNVAIW